MNDRTELAPYADPPAVSALKNALHQQRARFENLLPAVMEPEELFSVAIAAVQKTPKLLQCSQESLVKALLDAARLGVRPDGLLSEGWLVPRYNRKTKTTEAQFQLGYRGLELLMYRAGAKKIETRLVYDGEAFELTYGLNPNIVHVPRFDIDRSDEAVTGAYAWMVNRYGATVFEYMTRDELDAIRDRFAGRNDSGAIVGPWATDTGEMRRKTVLRRLAKHSELSTDEKEIIGRDFETERDETITVEKPTPKALPAAKRQRGTKRLRERLASSEPTTVEKETPNAEATAAEPPAEASAEGEADGSGQEGGAAVDEAPPADEAVEGEYADPLTSDGRPIAEAEPAEMDEAALLEAITEATGGELIEPDAGDEPAPEPEGEISDGLYIGRVAFPAAGEKYDGKLKTYPDGKKRTYFGLAWPGGELLVVAVEDVAKALFTGGAAPRFKLAADQRVKIAGKKHEPASGPFKGRTLLAASSIETWEPGT